MKPNEIFPREIYSQFVASQVQQLLDQQKSPFYQALLAERRAKWRALPWYVRAWRRLTSRIRGWRIRLGELIAGQEFD